MWYVKIWKNRRKIVCIRRGYVYGFECMRNFQRMVCTVRETMTLGNGIETNGASTWRGYTSRKGNQEQKINKTTDV